MKTLFFSPSTASMAVHILLEEIGEPFELKLVDRSKNEHKSAEYMKLNPNGVIPVLVDGDLVLYESAAICLHLADTHPQHALAPAFGTPQRATFYKWLVWMTNTLQATLIAYFYPERWVDEGNADGAAQVKARAEAKIGTLIDQLDAHLAASGGPWFLGEAFSVLDVYGMMLCRWTRGQQRPARTWPHVGPWLQRVLERPAVARVFEKEGIVAPLV